MTQGPVEELERRLSLARDYDSGSDETYSRVAMDAIALCRDLQQQLAKAQNDGTTTITLKDPSGAVVEEMDVTPEFVAEVLAENLRLQQQLAEQQAYVNEEILSLRAKDRIMLQEHIKLSDQLAAKSEAEGRLRNALLEIAHGDDVDVYGVATEALAPSGDKP